MGDMLVRLYSLPDPTGLVDALHAKGIEVRRAITPEMHIVVEWVRKTFGQGWASECTKAMLNSPVSCFVATQEGKLLGFACHDATARAYFGPTGVAEKARKQGIGGALLRVSLHAMWEYGYAYAIIGGAGPVDFYARETGAIPIPDSAPGIYRGMLGEKALAGI